MRFFIIFGIFALNACTTVRYESRPALEPLPVTGQLPIAEAEPAPKPAAAPKAKAKVADEAEE